MTVSGEIQRPWTGHYGSRDLARFCRLHYLHTVVSLSALYTVPAVIKKTKKQAKHPTQHEGSVSFLEVRWQGEKLPSQRQD